MAKRYTSAFRGMAQGRCIACRGKFRGPGERCQSCADKLRDRKRRKPR
jgi:rRNA maturation endonuclease Nob1